MSETMTIEGWIQTVEDGPIYPYTASLLNSTQEDLETLFSNHQLIPTIRKAFEDDGYAQICEECGIPGRFGIDLLVQMYLHKRASITTLVGIFMHHFEEIQDGENEEEDLDISPAQRCANMLQRAVEVGMVDLNPTNLDEFVVKFLVSEELEDRLEKFQYPLPMIEHPEILNDNRDTGYRTIRKSVILKKQNHIDDDVCLDHINRVNHVPLSINPHVVHFMQNSWKGLDKQKEGETDEEYLARRRAFEKYDRISRDVIQALQIQGNCFWLTHRYDFRGRTYAQGYHVNYQGNDWNKACVQLARTEYLMEE